MRFMALPFLLLLMPLAEIAAFVFVGREIGIGPTLLLVVAGVAVGGILLKVQGLGALRQIQDAARGGADPGRPIVHGLMIVIAAFLLIVPGFISDILGLLLFIPAVRDFAWSLVKSRVTVVATGAAGTRHSAQGGHPRNRPTQVIDLGEDDFSRTGRGGETDGDRQDRLR